MTYCSPNLNELVNMARTLPQFSDAATVEQDIKPFTPKLIIL
jgi:hypothetical protein